MELRPLVLHDLRSNSDTILLSYVGDRAFTIIDQIDQSSNKRIAAIWVHVCEALRFLWSWRWARRAHNQWAYESRDVEVC